MPAVALTAKATSAPLFWSILLIPWWLLVYGLWFLTVLLRLLIYVLVVLLLLGWTVPVLAFAGGLTLPITTSQNEFFKAATKLGNIIQGIVTEIKALIDQLLQCKEVVVELWNNWMRFFAAVIKRIFSAVDNVLNLNLPPIFDWADRAIKMEQASRELELQEEIRDMLVKYEYEITNRTRTIDPQHRSMYLMFMKNRLFKITKAHTIGRNLNERERRSSFLRITLLPAQLCDILNGIFEFLLGLLNIFSSFFLDFLDALLDVFNVLTGDFDQSFLLTLVQFIIVEILLFIPFTACFVNPDDLETTPIADWGQLFEDQTPSRLISCMCPWRYRNPFNFQCFLASNPAPECDTPPTNPGAAFIGCICFNPSVDINADSEPIDLLIRCLGVDVLINTFNSFVQTLQNVYVVIINGLQTAYQGILTAVNFLEQQFNELFKLFKKLDKLVRSDGPYFPEGVTRDSLTLEQLNELEARYDEINADTEKLEKSWDRWRNMFKNLLDAQKIRDNLIKEMYQQMTNRTYVDYMHSTPEYQRWSRVLTPTSEAVLSMLYRMRNQVANMTRMEQVIRPDWQEQMQQRYSKMLADMPKSPWFVNMENKLYDSFNARDESNTSGTSSTRGKSGLSREEIKTELRALTGGLRGILSVGAWTLANKKTMQEVMMKLDEDVDMEGLIRSVFRLNRAKRGLSVPEHEAISAARVASKVWTDASFNAEALPRTIRELEKRYGQKSDTMVRGIRMAARILPKKVATAPTRMQEVMEEYELNWDDITRTTKDITKKARRMKKENDAKVSEIFEATKYAQVKYERFLDWSTATYMRFNEEMPEQPTTRIIAIGVTITAGAAVSFVSVAGFFVGAGLSVLATLLVGLIGPILLIVVIFIGTIIQFIVQIAVGLIFNTFRGDDTRPMFDFFTPYILALTDLVADSFVNGYNLPDLLSAVDDIGDITVDNLEYTLEYFIRDRLCSIPLRLPPYTCPREPLLDEDGRPDEGIVDYILNAIFYFPQDEQCTDSDDCGGGDCVCPGFPSRFGTYQSPCTVPLSGYCNGWPLIAERIGFDDVSIDIELDPQCDKVLNIPIEGLTYYDGPVFQKEGFSVAWIKSAEFRTFLWNIFYTGYIILRFAIQRIILGGFLRWSGTFVGIGGILWFVPTPILSAIALTTLLGNTLTTTLNDWGARTITFAEGRQSAALLGPFYTELLLWLRFPNYAEQPPFGFARTVDWVCVLAAIPAGAIAASAAIPLGSILLGLLLSGFFFWLFFFIFDILFFPLNWALLLGRILIVNGLLYRRGVIRSAIFNGYVRASAAEGVRRYGPAAATAQQNNSPFFTQASITSTTSTTSSALSGRRAVARSTYIGKQPFHRNYLRIGNEAQTHGAHPIPLVEKHRPVTSKMVKAGSYTLYSKTRDDEPAMSWPAVIGNALHSTLMAVPSLFTLQGISDVNRAGPLNLRRSLGYETAPSTSDVMRHEFVVLDEHVAHEHHEGFPLTAYLIAGNGLSVLHDENIVAIHTHCLHRCMDDEHSASYHHL